MSDSRRRRDRRHSNLLLIRDLQVLVQCIVVNVRFLFTSWNGFLRPAAIRHTWQPRYSLQVHALMMKPKTLYFNAFFRNKFSSNLSLSGGKSVRLHRSTLNPTHRPPSFSDTSIRRPVNTAITSLTLHKIFRTAFFKKVHNYTLISNINGHMYVRTLLLNDRLCVLYLSRQKV